jgi:heat shock protein HtpX
MALRTLLFVITNLAVVLTISLILSLLTGSSERWLHNTVARLAEKAELPMPEVGIYGSPEWNAFATGPSPQRALVAVSTGILQGISEEELEAVLGHEMSHVGNGDMVTPGFLRLFASHPPIEARIQALRSAVQAGTLA